MAQINDLLVTGASRFLNSINATADKAICDQNGISLSSGYMKKGIDYVTAGIKSGTTAGSYSTAEGYNTTSSNSYSHAEGHSTTASGTYSHAEGYYTTASNTGAHAEGYSTTASGSYSHAEGYSSQATTSTSHAEGYSFAQGYYSHTEGTGTASARSYYTHVQGMFTTALAGNYYAFVCGTYNRSYNTTDRFIIGNGTNGGSGANNALIISNTGRMTFGYTGGYSPATRQANSSTIPNLINELKTLGVTMGSMSLSAAASIGNKTIPASWYTYVYIPYATNTQYGALWLIGMNNTNYTFYIPYVNGATPRAYRT